MTIQFNNIPSNLRTPGVYNEIDNSRALQGLAAITRRALILGQRISAGATPDLELKQITRTNQADGFFGPGAITSRMCNTFKENNETTELWAMSLSDNAAGAKASGTIYFSASLSDTGYSLSGDGTLYLLVDGQNTTYTALTSGWSTTDVNSAVETTIDADSTLPVVASTNATSALNLVAVNTGEHGNYIDFRFNYFANQSFPAGFGSNAPLTSAMAGGANNPDLGDAWAVIENEKFDYIIQPYIDAANLTEIENELADRFLPLTDQQGHGFTAARATVASATTLGNSRNSPHNTIAAADNSPSSPETWGSAWGAQAAKALINDPARPLHYLTLKGVLPPPQVDRFTQTERNILLTDGIASYVVDTVGNVQIERSITTYQTNALGLSDTSYLDIQTLATLSEIRDQYKIRMQNRFLIPRFKLADDGITLTPGAKIVTPSVIKQEIIALFTQLEEAGLIENLDDFIDNLIVERDATDVNRVNALLPPDLINQFRVLASLIQFIL
jgi:phage tail sheath gpL-like